MEPPENWASDWGSFVKKVAELFRQGLSAEDVTDHFAGQRVVWSGVVSKVDSGHHFGLIMPGVEMAMAPIRVKLPRNRNAKVDYLFLSVRRKDFPLWSKIKLGSVVQFSTEIAQSGGLSPGISWSELTNNRAVILFSTRDAIPIKRK
jgi:hypothetical protein